MKAALRLGLIYWAVLLLVFALGHRNQVEKEANARLERELQALEAQKAALVMEKWRLLRPERLLAWAEEEGFVPKSLGRWSR